MIWREYKERYISRFVMLCSSSRLASGIYNMIASGMNINDGMNTICIIVDCENMLIELIRI
jgi:hypothetical protein